MEGVCSVTSGFQARDQEHFFWDLNRTDNAKICCTMMKPSGDVHNFTQTEIFAFATAEFVNSVYFDQLVHSLHRVQGPQIYAAHIRPFLLP